MSTITVELDATAALAGELSLLAAQLAEERPLCSAAAAALLTGLDGEVGLRAAECAVGWAELVGVLAERCAATGRTLGEAVEQYRALEAAISADISAAISAAISPAISAGRAGAPPAASRSSRGPR